MKKHLLCLIVLITTALMAHAQDDVTATFDPADGSKLTELSTFNITFNVPMKVDFPEGVTLLRNGLPTGAEIKCSVSEDQYTVKVEIVPAQTQDGKYTFKYLDNIATPAKSSYGSTPLLNLTYYIGEAGELPVVMRANPENNSTVESIRDILIMFENVETLSIDKKKSVYLTDGVKKYPYFITDGTNGYQVQILAMPNDEELTIRKGGTYTLVIEDGALILNGNSWGCELKYFIEAIPEIVSTEPGEEIYDVNELNEITITWNMDVTALTSYMLRALQLYKVNDEGQIDESVAGYTVTIDSENPKVVHLIADGEVEIYEDGEYSLSIPPTLFVFGSKKNLASSIRFIVKTSGINDINVSDDKSQVIYNINGIRVNGDGNAPGIYIINGKKVLIK